MGFQLEEATIQAMQHAMESGELTSQQLVKMYLERIQAYDQQGPAVNSVLEINPDAFQIAAELDRERAATGSRGPLHGIPVLVKDNIDTQDRMHTSAGSLALAEQLWGRNCGKSGLSFNHCSSGIHTGWKTGRCHVYGQIPERTPLDHTGVCVRTGHPASKTATIVAHRRVAR